MAISPPGCALELAIALSFAAGSPGAAQAQWSLLSSSKADLPSPGGSNQQTGVLVANLGKREAAGFVVSCRAHGPALAWMRRSAKGWERYVIERDFLTVEAGGAAHDIDGDGDLDIVFGQDSQGNQPWWWENPYRNLAPEVPWKSRLIQSSGANQQHDQIFAHFKGTGKPQLVYRNQSAKALFSAEIPMDLKSSGDWPAAVVYSGQAGEQVNNAAQYAEGPDSFGVDGDGKGDLLAGSYWFKYCGGGLFEPVKIGSTGGRIRAGKLRKGEFPPVVIAPGDGSGPVRLYEAKGDPAISSSWVGRDLLSRDVVHGHTLEVGDIDGDEDLDVLNKPCTWQAPRVDIWLNSGTARSPFRLRLGMELWTYRNELKRDLPGTLAMIRRLGFTDVETGSFFGHTAAELRRMLDEEGLSCSSSTTGDDRLWAHLATVAAEATAPGAKYVLTAGIPHKGDLTEAQARQAAADFNSWGEKLLAQGLKFGYHPHGFEFVKTATGKLFDVLIEQTDPRFVSFELDVFWLIHGGADPVRHLEKHPARFEMMHLKEMAKGTPTGLTTGKAPDETSAALGTGMISWPAVLKAAKKAGLRYYYIEDERLAAFAQVPVTLEFLKKQRF
jgi:sugar phosphate isomerase/epimerase